MTPDGILCMMFCIIIGSLSIAFAILSYRKNDSYGSKYCGALFVALSIWSFGTGLEYLITPLTTNIFLIKIKFIGVVLVPVLVLFFVLEYAGWKKYLTKRNMLFLLMIPFFTIFFLATNDFHHLFYASATYLGSSYLLISTAHGPWYIVHVIYSYLLIVASVILLTFALFSLPRYYRGRVSLLIFGILVGSAINLLYVFVLPNLQFDLTLIAFLIMGMVVYISLFMLPNTDILPVAKKTLINLMDDGVYLLDNSGKVVEVNRAGMDYATSISSSLTEHVVGRDIYMIFNGIEEYIHDHNSETLTWTMKYIRDSKELHYDFTLRSLHNDVSTGGSLLMIRDVSDYYSYKKELTIAKERYKNLFNNLRDGIILHSRKGKGLVIHDVNLVMKKMLKCSPDFKIDSGDFLEKTKIVSILLNEEVIDIPGNILVHEEEIICADGTTIPVRISSRIVHFDGEQILSVVRDITDEVKVRESERESLAQIEENIEKFSILNDHIRNPLMVIVGRCMGLDDLTKSEIIEEQVGVIDKIIQKVDIRCTESERFREQFMGLRK